MTNKLLNNIKNYRNDSKKFLSLLSFLLSFATLPNSKTKINSHFQNDLISIFNDFLANKKEFNQDEEKYINQILLLIESYFNIDKNKFNIDSNLYNKSLKFNKKYIEKYSTKMFYLSSSQQNIFLSILDHTNNIYCMPTSFGKSLIIKLVSLYRANNGQRTFICVPTIALINEYIDDFRKLNKQKEQIKISSIPNDSSQIFILTQERLIDIETKENDLLIVDESYEIDNKNIRSAILKSICNRFKKEGRNTKFFQPNCLEINNSSYFIKNQIIIHDINTKLCSQLIRERKRDINKSIIDITKESICNGEKIAIYSNKSNHLKLAEKIDNELKNEEIKNDYINLLIDIFSEDYIPVSMLKKGIVINNGDMPKIFRYLSEKMYKTTDIKIIICNNTLSKGVNLGIKNLIINSKNGISNKWDLNDFEIKNLIGRVGRITNNINDRIGNVYICLSDDNNIKKIKNINRIDKIKYEENSRDIDDIKYDKYIKEIDDGTFEPWKYLLDNFDDNEEVLLKFLNENFEIIKNFYSNKRNDDDYDNFYNFIIKLYGGEHKFILNFFKTKKQGFKEFDEKLTNSEKVQNYYINIRTKKYIFNYVFRNYELKRIVMNQFNYYSNNNYYFYKNNFYNNEKVLKENDKSNLIYINRVEKGSKVYKKIITKITNEILNDSSSFYDGSFQLIENKIFKIFSTIYNIQLLEKTDEISKIIDYYNLPKDFREILIKHNIDSIEKFNNSFLFKLIN